MAERTDRMNGSRSNRGRQQEWRDRVPELSRLIEHVSPRLWQSAREERKKDVPDEWKALVASMRQAVHEEATAATYHDEALGRDERLGYHWSFKVGRVADMLEHLTNAILEDLVFEDRATLGSIVLLKQAMIQLELELQDGGTKGGREDRLENRYRVQEAMKVLISDFDDVQMRRLRALQWAGPAARHTHIPTPADVERRLSAIREHESFDAEESERHRKWFEVDQPAMSGVMVRSWLAEVDERFGSLDPLVVLEEFADAQAESEGGRDGGGDVRTGPARALARLAVMCGALDFEQREGEDFDAAVERARSNLLVTRSRIKKAVQSFPNRMPDDENE